MSQHNLVAKARRCLRVVEDSPSPEQDIMARISRVTSSTLTDPPHIVMPNSPPYPPHTDKKQKANPKKLSLPNVAVPMANPIDSLFPNAAELDGVKVLRGAVPANICAGVAKAIDQGLPQMSNHDGHSTFVVSVLGYQIRDEFVKHAKVSLKDFYTPLKKKIPTMPKSISIGQYQWAHEPNPLLFEILHTGHPFQIYVTIALSRLQPENGLHLFLKGSHGPKHPRLTAVNLWEKTNLTLEPGDAIIWRGDLSYMRTNGVGGQWETLVFDWGPGMVDLTMPSPPSSRG